MPVTLIRTVNNIDLQLKDKRSREILTSFYKYLKSKGVSENYMNNALKVGLKFCRYYDMQKSIDDIKEKQDILNFLDTKVKTQEEDPDKRWITTWNFYLLHIKIFFRWYYNRFSEEEDNREWKTPSFLKIKNKKTKRLSPYIESEIWSKEEFLLIIKYEGNRRNKAALSLMWDMDARNHEVTLLKIKNVRLKERYGEGEIPSDAKTGSGPLLLTCSFPYVRDWLNEHPFRNEPNASLICNLHNGAPVKSEVIWNIMKHLKKRIIRFMDEGLITDIREKEKLEDLINIKKWNPYCIRHSSISADSDYLPEYALKKKVRWSMNSKQGSRYIKTRMGNELKNKILEYNGIVVDSAKKQKPSILNCPRCELTNALENKYCSKCSYPLTPEAFDQIKQGEEQRLMEMEQRYTEKIEKATQDMEYKIQQLMVKVNFEKLGTT